ncbi:MAG: hypothetical protein Q9195_004152 [Heterodermia aff. obscurata]
MVDVSAVSTTVGSSLIFIFYASVLALLSVFIRQRYFSPISSVPGPSLGTVGTFFQVWEICRGRINHTLSQLHREHGSFVRISYNEVSVCHPDAIQILAAPIWKAPFYKPFAIPTSSYNNLMSERDPKRYGRMRTNVASAFALTNIIKSESVLDEVITLFERRLDEFSQRRKPLEFGKWLHFLTYDLLGEIMFSNRFGFLDEGRDVGGSIGNNFYQSLYLSYAFYIQWLHAILLGNPILRWIEFQPNTHTFNTATKSIKKRMADTMPRMDMMEQFLVQHEKKPDNFTAINLTASVTMTLGAGGGTMGAVLDAFFYFLLKANPYHLQRLREEIDNAQLSTVVSFAEAQQLPYLQCVTILSVNPWLIHRNSDCFGQDADTYNPDRWLADKPAVQRMEKYLISFGLGYNSCPGRSVANIELSKITATLIRDFDFRLADPDAEWKYHQLFVTSQYESSVFVERRTG